MPPNLKWFALPSPRMPYDVQWRAEAAGSAVGAGQLAALLKAAPDDFQIGVSYLQARFGQKPPIVEINTVFARRMGYDLRVIDYAIPRIPEDNDRLSLLSWACQIAPGECVELAATLVRLGRPGEAVGWYEQAFANPEYDQIGAANSSEWLVTYYSDHGQLPRALALAARSAATGSLRGLLTAAHLYERLKRFEEAEVFYKHANGTYRDAGQLLGFYYRAINVRKQVEYQGAWDALLPTVFPHGLQPVPKSFDAQPATAVIITDDNATVRKAGFQTGDLIVGLEGFRIENVKQYRAVNVFFSRDEIKLTLWRGQVFERAITVPNRCLGIQFRTYPIVGWAEE